MNFFIFYSFYSFAIALLRRQGSDKATAVFSAHPLLQPVVATLDETLAAVIYKCVACRVHRVWIVDAHRKPTGVLALSDLLENFV